MRVKKRVGSHLIVAVGDSGAVNILEEDCVAELPGISELPWRIFFFWPLNGSKVTITCHGGDLIDGHREVVISEDKIHAVLGMKNRYHADFKIVPVISMPEQKPEPTHSETAA